MNYLVTDGVKAIALLLLAFCCVLWGASVSAAPTDDFVITVYADNSGLAVPAHFTIPTIGIGYNYNVDCNDDGNNEVTAANGNYTCVYPTAGVYTIRIKDNSGERTGFPRIYFNNYGDKLKLLSINQWGTGRWTSMARAFYGCSNMLGQFRDVPDLSSVTDMSYMFAYASQFNSPIGNWDTSNITNMRSVFSSATSFNRPIGNWDTSNVVDMRAMFNNARAFNQEIGSWDTSKVTTMQSMFVLAMVFNGHIGGWDTSNVTNMSGMFNGTIFNRDISGWNTSNVVTMARMFGVALRFNQPIGQWDTSNVVDMSNMFNYALEFNQDISQWNTSKVTNMSRMFLQAPVFNADVGAWDTANVTTMWEMFRDAVSFNRDIGSWNIESVADMSSMFTGAKLSSINYDDLLADWSAQNVRSGLIFNAGFSTYCESTAARNDLITNHGWSIVDDGPDCTPYNGSCGPSNGTTLTSAPKAYLCDTGSAGAVAGSGPWSWSCHGRYGGIDASCSANVQTYSISTAANPAAGGTMDCTPNPVNHGSNSSCAASPNAGYLFVGFSGDCNGSACNLTNVTANKSVTANFREQTGNVFYHPITPCRLADTRIDSRGGAFGQQTTREFNAVPEAADLSSFGGKATGCGIPPWAVAVHANFTAVGPPASGYLRAWPWGQGEPNATLFAWPPTFGATNAATVPVCQGDSCDYDVNVKIYSSQPIDLVIDAVGYYSP